MRMQPTIFLVDNDAADRDLNCSMIQALGLNCECYSSADAFLAAYHAERPGCVITELPSRKANGFALQHELAKRKSTLPVIVVSDCIGVEDTVFVMKAGAQTVLRKPVSEQQLWDAIRQALVRDAELRTQHALRAELRGQFETLTTAEREILNLVVTGLPNKTVAKRLNVSVRTVEDRRRRIMKKLRVDSFARLMEKVFEAKHLESTLI